MFICQFKQQPLSSFIVKGQAKVTISSNVTLGSSFSSGLNKNESLSVIKSCIIMNCERRQLLLIGYI